MTSYCCFITSQKYAPNDKLYIANSISKIPALATSTSPISAPAHLVIDRKDPMHFPGNHRTSSTATMRGDLDPNPNPNQGPNYSNPNVKSHPNQNLTTPIVKKNFVRTYGNALRDHDPSLDSSMVRITVPPGMKSGQTLNVSLPNSHSGGEASGVGNESIIHTIIPPGLVEGSNFSVTVPPPTPIPTPTQSAPLSPSHNAVCQNGSVSVMDEQYPLAPQTTTIAQSLPPVTSPNSNLDLNPTVNPSLNKMEMYGNVWKCLFYPDSNVNLSSTSHAKGQTILVTAPKGVKPGTTILVKIPGTGGSIPATIPTTVPNTGSNGNSPQFYVTYDPADLIMDHDKNGTKKTKGDRKKQNWHDNPAAYAAPMIVGPMLLL